MTWTRSWWQQSDGQTRLAACSIPVSRATAKLSSFVVAEMKIHGANGRVDSRYTRPSLVLLHAGFPRDRRVRSAC
jgi:hypothetical protein